MDKIDKILDDLSYCGGTGKWDKHYLDTVEEIRLQLIEMTEPKVDQADVCELAHAYTENECLLRGIEIDRQDIDWLDAEQADNIDTTYSPEAQEIFDRHYKLITETLGV
jgi:hypothetical protein